MDETGFIVADEHAHERGGRVRGRRRAGPRLQAGRDGGRLRLHGRARSRTLPRVARAMSDAPAAVHARRLPAAAALHTALPVRLIIGILAGLLGGGSLFGLLQRVAETSSGRFDHAADRAGGADARGGRRAHAGRDAALARQRLAGDGSGVPTSRTRTGRMTWQFLVLSLMRACRCSCCSVAGQLPQPLLHALGRRARGARPARRAVRPAAEPVAQVLRQERVGQLISRCTNDATVVENVISATRADLTRAPIEIAAARRLCRAVLDAATTARPGGADACWSFPLCIVPIVVLGHACETLHAARARADLRAGVAHARELHRHPGRQGLQHGSAEVERFQRHERRLFPVRHQGAAGRAADDAR